MVRTEVRSAPSARALELGEIPTARKVLFVVLFGGGGVATILGAVLGFGLARPVFDWNPPSYPTDRGGGGLLIDLPGGDGSTSSTGVTTEHRPEEEVEAPTVGDEDPQVTTTTTEPGPGGEAPCTVVETPVTIVAGQPCPTSVIPPDLLEDIPLSSFFGRLL